MQEPRWLKDAAVAIVHQRQLAAHGGLAGVRDPGLLSSALTRPRNLFHYSRTAPDLAALAAAYMCGIIKNHPFVDGNKRTGYVVGCMFLILNGYDLDANEEEKYQTAMGVADRSLDEVELINWIRSKMYQCSDG